MTGGARWRGHSHPELYSMINSGPGAGASDAQTQYWKSLTQELTEIDNDLNKALSNLNASWQGQASDSATTGMTPLQAWAGDARTGSNVMGISTELQADYIASARAAMPKPVPVTTPEPSAWQTAAGIASSMVGNPGPAAQVAQQALDHERQEAAQSAAADKAVDTMNNYESSSRWNSNTLGEFVPPPDVVVSTPPPAGTAVAGGQIGAWMTGGAAPGPDGTGTTTTTSSFTTPPGGGGGGNPPPLPGGGGGGGGGGPLPGGGGGGGLPSGTTPNQFAPPVPPPTPQPPVNLPPSPGPGPGPGPFPGPGPVPGPGPGPGPLPPGNTLPNPGNGPTGGKPGGLPTGPRGGGPLPNFGGLPGGPGGGPGGTGGPGSGGLGAFGADPDGSRSASQLGRGGGTGLVAGEGMGGRGGGAGGPGAGGGRGAGMGGAPMGAGGAQGEEDDEHFSPDYLLETADVFGDDRLVSPAVIGEDAPNEDK